MILRAIFICLISEKNGVQIKEGARNAKNTVFVLIFRKTCCVTDLPNVLGAGAENNGCKNQSNVGFHFELVFATGSFLKKKCFWSSSRFRVLLWYESVLQRDRYCLCFELKFRMKKNIVVFAYV